MTCPELYGKPTQIYSLEKKEHRVILAEKIQACYLKNKNTNLYFCFHYHEKYFCFLMKIVIIENMNV